MLTFKSNVKPHHSNESQLTTKLLQSGFCNTEDDKMNSVLNIRHLMECTVKSHYNEVLSFYIIKVRFYIYHEPSTCQNLVFLRMECQNHLKYQE